MDAKWSIGLRYCRYRSDVGGLEARQRRPSSELIALGSLCLALETLTSGPANTDTAESMKKMRLMSRE